MSRKLLKSDAIKTVSSPGDAIISLCDVYYPVKWRILITDLCLSLSKFISQTWTGGVFRPAESTCPFYPGREWAARQNNLMVIFQITRESILPFTPPPPFFKVDPTSYVAFLPTNLFLKKQRGSVHHVCCKWASKFCCWHNHCSRQGEVRLAPRAVFLDAQRSFFSSKKEEEATKTAAEEEKPEVSEAEKALNERIAELEEKHDEVWLPFQIHLNITNFARCLTNTEEVWQILRTLEIGWTSRSQMPRFLVSRASARFVA